ncbi:MULTISPECIES: hypothetical protein [unclassified Streptomyces]|uniref:hypothetical protein n=1 Tax=unclassified Streptomyces TaxID=2593676 RepID=UPI000AC9E4C4|nr:MULTISPECIES: hypothetical protein [unclassified Streptomyces]
MAETPVDAACTGDDADRKVVEQEHAEIREFIKGLSADDIKSGNWFTKLSAHALNSYTNKVDWQYFQERYAGVPADAIVDQRHRPRRGVAAHRRRARGSKRHSRRGRQGGHCGRCRQRT